MPPGALAAKVIPTAVMSASTLMLPPARSVSAPGATPDADTALVTVTVLFADSETDVVPSRVLRLFAPLARIVVVPAPPKAMSPVAAEPPMFEMTMMSGSSKSEPGAPCVAPRSALPRNSRFRLPETSA